jgi:hypothetical protein
VAGYYLYWGLSSGACTNQLNVGNVTNATLGGLATNETYYITVVAYDASGDQGPPSNMITYPTVPTISGVLSNKVGSPRSLSLNFQASTGMKYSLQATTNFVTWTTLLTTNCSTNGLISVHLTDPASYSRRFYRLTLQ